MTHYPDYLDGELDSQSNALLTHLADTNARPTSSLSVAEARAQFLDPASLGAGAPGIDIRDVAVPGSGGPLRLRVYAPPGGGPDPMVLFFHGGGFVVGTVEEFDPVCTRLAAAVHTLVVSVDYRLGPEHPVPAAMDDAATALRWVAGHASELGGDVSRLAVMGDSAGGNLATCAARHARDEGLPRPCLQVLVSPWVDLARCDSRSFRHFGGGRWLSAATIDWYRRHCLADLAVARDPRASPLLVEDLSGLPPAFVVNAEFDVLRDQVADYTCRLTRAGVAADYRLYRGVLHDFALLPGAFDRAIEAEADVCDALRRAFAGRAAADASIRFSNAALEAMAADQYLTGDAGFPLDPAHSALVVIDMQEEFVTPAGGPYRVPEAARRVPAVARLLSAFRQHRWPVIHTAFAATHHGLDRPRHGSSMPNRVRGDGVGETALFRSPRFVEELRPRPSEVVILKPSYGAFYDTPLETILRRLGADTVVLAGTLTDCCVGTTARQAYERGFGAVVASDATATTLPEMHEAELRILRRSFARVLTVDRILAELEAAAGQRLGPPA